MKKIIKTTEKFVKVLLVLMFSFSQLSFPLEVLADELTTEVVENENQENIRDEENMEEEQQPEEPIPPQEEVPESPEEGKYIVTINGEEVSEYTITDENKIVTIHQEYTKEGDYTFDNEETILDFTNKLYGTYYYCYSVSNENETIEMKNITIHYEGDNSILLNEYSTLTYDNGTYDIEGKNTPLTVKDILSTFNQEELFQKYEATLEIIDEEEHILGAEDSITGAVKIVLRSKEITEVYSLNIKGDHNQDGIVDIEDAKNIIDNILENETEENVFNILDATHPVFITGSWENNIEAKDTLTNSLVHKTEINKGEELEVKYYINGFEFDMLTGIEGKINYNKELLELTSVDIEGLYGSINEEGHFAYLLDNYQSNGIFMTLTFKALKAGVANISVDDIIASIGVEASLESNNIMTTVTITDFGKGGDVELTDPITPVPEPTPVKTEEIPQPVIITTNKGIQRVSLSTDNSIKSLTIKGYNIKFDQNTYEYSIKVKNNVKSLNLDILLNDEKARYEVNGNENFKVGENNVTIKVIAENGNEKTYTIKVNKEKEKKTTETEEKEEKSSSKTIIIILIVLVIIGLIYVIFKDDEDDKKDSKK